VEAMDYIVKGRDDIKARIEGCMQNAYAKYTSKSTPLQDNFVFSKSKERMISVPCDSIYYFTTSSSTPHNVIVITENARYEFRGSLMEIQTQLDERFFRCHRSFIVNVKKISALNKLRMELQLFNGGIIYVSAKYIIALGKLMHKLSMR